MWHGGDGMGWWMLWGGLMMFLFWGGILALIVWAVQAFTGRDTDQKQPPPSSPPRANPLEIAKERYARGDLARDEFEQIKKDLENS